MKDIHSELISVIVPVYNVEQYLKKCIDSIIAQTYENIEIILIDDGSTDNSGTICDDYKIKNPKIRVFHKINGGLSSARNLGIEKSKGKYLTFVDSDDTIEKDYIEYLYNLIKKYNTEMSICSYNVIKNKKIDFGKNLEEELLSTEKCLYRLLCEKGFTISACAKMYNKTLFDNIRFPLNKLCEDNGTTYKLIMKCPTIAYGNIAKYNYLIRKDSITTSSFNIKKMDLIELVDMMCDDIYNKYPSLEDVILKKRNNARFSILRQLLEEDNTRYLNIQNEIINYLKNNYHQIIKNKESDFKDKIGIVLLKIDKKMFRFGWKIYMKFFK